MFGFKCKINLDCDVRVLPRKDKGEFASQILLCLYFLKIQIILLNIKLTVSSDV